MIPKKVTLENFLSFGARTEIAFTDDEPLWVLGGPNGVGKSAVFDAITFCLFGSHRGGAKEIDPLIRHGTNGFSVSFEFEFGGVDYKITRNRIGRTTQAVEQKRADGNGWERVPNINSIADVKGWSERTLGLGFDAFKSSVLLRQGEADAIILATGAERLKILKKIIGVEPFEDLSKRVHEAARGKIAEREGAIQRREKSEEVKEADREAAQAVVEAAESARAEADKARAAASHRIALARQWITLVERCRQFTERMREADERAAQAEQIRREKDRLDELTAVLPTAARLVPLRDSVVEAERRLGAVRDQHARAEADRVKLTQRCEELRQRINTSRDAAKDLATRAESSRKACQQAERFLVAARAVNDLEKQLKAYDPNLDDNVAAADRTHATADAEAQKARNSLTRIKTLLDQALHQQKEFDQVEEGVKCSRCGQTVTAKHAATERKRMAEDVAALTTQRDQAARAQKDADQALTQSKRAKETLTQTATARNSLRQRLADQQSNLKSLGVDPDPDRLASEAKRMKSETEEFERQQQAESAVHKTATTDLTREETALKTRTQECEKLSGEIEKLEKATISDRATVQALTSQLRPSWQSVTQDQLASGSKELAALKAARIDERSQQLMEDEARRDEWDKQLRDAETEREGIPETARVPLSEAEQLDGAAKSAFEDADRAFQQARDALAELNRKAEEHEKLKREVEASEREARIHQKLDDLLGKTGLQRELVREAEEKIVGLANETMKRLDGDLSIELDQSDESGDEAFALRVRASDDPTPTAVTYLSGSQKFRVAISVALAIGRFAAGQARPLESVIIDEGFGSLDKDGLRAAAIELNRLKQFLKRIILVSHQEEFTEHFPVVIRLSKGESGAVAEAVRR